ISEASGRKRASTPAAANFSESDSTARGYFVKSSLGPNCFGFTKMEATTGAHSCFARCTSAVWPACKAPMVGTKPMMRLSARACRAASFIQAMVRMVSTIGGAGTMPALRFGGDGALAIVMHQVGEDCRHAELTQQGRDLAAMVAAVIHDVLHRLPERVAVDAELQRFVFHDAIEIALVEIAHEIEEARLELAPALAEGRDVGILRCVRE